MTVVYENFALMEITKHDNKIQNKYHSNHTYGNLR